MSKLSLFFVPENGLVEACRRNGEGNSGKELI